MLVKDVMAVGAITIHPSGTVAEAADLMHRENVGMLVVEDGSAIQGVVTDRDLLVGCIGDYHHPKVCQVGRHMSKPVTTTEAGLDALEAARMMRRHRIRRLPVLEDGQLVGVVSFSDIARSVQQAVHDVLIGFASPKEAKTPRRIGRVSHYFSKIGVAGLDLDQPIRKGDRIYISGHTTDFEQTVGSLEINHEQVDFATPGQPAAIKVRGRARPGDGVFVEAEAA
ncbi:MAG: CBS domain-containing protein [Chloroflexi bacterium]|nr:CBS domain-containing protein [Chloroflexota bacterium]